MNGLSHSSVNVVRIHMRRMPELEYFLQVNIDSTTNGQRFKNRVKTIFRQETAYSWLRFIPDRWHEGDGMFRSCNLAFPYGHVEIQRE